MDILIFFHLTFYILHRSLSFAPDSQLLVTASDDSHIKLYDVQNATLISNMTGHQSWVLSVDFSPDNAHYVTREAKLLNRPY